MKKGWILLAALAIAALMMMMSASAEAPQGLTIDGVSVETGSGVGWTYANNVLKITSGNHTLSGTTSASVAVSGSAAITLDGLHIETNAAHAIAQTSSSLLSIALVSDNSLVSPNYALCTTTLGQGIEIQGNGSLSAAGIATNGEGALTLRSGRLTVTPGRNDAPEYRGPGKWIGIRADFRMLGGSVEIIGCREGGIVGSFRQSAGTVIIRGDGTRSFSHGIGVGLLEIDGGSLSIDLESAWYAEGIQMFSGNTGVIRGGSVNITIRDREEENGSAQNFYGILGSMNIEGGSVDIKLISPDNSFSQYGVYGDCSISGGDVRIDLNGKYNAEGIAVSSTKSAFSFSQSGGALAIGISSDYNSYGIRGYKNSSVRFTGGSTDIDVDCGNFSDAYGIQITNGTMDFGGGVQRIDAPGHVYVGKPLESQSAITVSGGALMASAASAPVTAGGGMYFIKQPGGEYELQGDANITGAVDLPAGYAFTSAANRSISIAVGGSLNVAAGSSLAVGGPFENLGSASGDIYSPITAITLPASLDLAVGIGAPLGVEVQQTGGVENTIALQVSDPAIALVEGQRITGQTLGSTTLNASFRGVQYATCPVNVVEVAEPVTSIVLTAAKQDLNLGEKLSVAAQVLPVGATIPRVEWVSGSPAVAEVSPSGEVTALYGGTAVIETRALDGSGVVGSLTVRVLQPVTKIEVSAPSAAVLTGKTLQLAAQVSPENATEQAVRWESEDESIATVGEDGLVTGVSAGTATISAHATDESGVSGTLDVEVRQAVEDVTFTVPDDRGALFAFVGDVIRCSVRVQPEEAYDLSVTWSSSDAGVVEMGDDGLVTLRAPGESTIRAEAADGSGAYAEFTLTVREEPAGIALPAALTAIEARAFGGSAIGKVSIGAGVAQIGSRAFADSPALQKAVFLGSDCEIADDAFDGSEQVVIYAPAGSSAIAFAKANGVPYAALDEGGQIVEAG